MAPYNIDPLATPDAFPQRAELSSRLARAMYFFGNATAEIDAIRGYLYPLSEPYLLPEDIQEVNEKIDDELNHLLGNIASAIERLGVYPSEDELAEILARLAAGVDDKASFIQRLVDYMQ